MNRTTTALLAALEALIIVAIGVGIALVPLTILWAAHFGLAIDWFVFWRAAVDIWLLGNGVDLTVRLDPATVTALSLPDAGAPFTITIAMLGFAVLAVAFGLRTGKRAAETGYPRVGVIASILTYALLSLLLAFSAAGEGVVQPAVVQSIVLPPAVYALGVLIGAAPRLGWGERAREPGEARTPGSRNRAADAIRRFIAPEVRAVTADALRGGSAVAGAVIAVSAVAVGVLVLANYATIIGLYETLQAGVVGGITLTLAQLALIPNLVVWAAAWFIGPGIALGTGTSVSPVGTSLGPVPGLPILGALPHGSLAFGFLGLIVPVVIGFACAVVIRQRMQRGGTAPTLETARAVDGATPSLQVQLATGVGMGLVAGVLLGLLAWWSSGALGPGRLADVGPNPLLVGVLAFVEVGIAACVGMLVGRRAGGR
jgi:hypothetical protein